MPRLSAGLLMYRIKDGGIQVLLAHPGGPFFQNKDDGAWSVPKGEPDADEDLLITAQREFEEETGIKPTGPFVLLKPIKQKGGRRRHPRTAATRRFGQLPACCTMPTMTSGPKSIPDGSWIGSGKRARRRLPLIHRILEDYSLPWFGIHGVGHWARVLETNGWQRTTDAPQTGDQIRSPAEEDGKEPDHGENREEEVGRKTIMAKSRGSP